MSDSSSSSAPLRLVVRLVLTIALVWALPTLLPSFITIEGGIGAVILIGITLMLLNIIVRPIINILTFPLKMFMTVVAIILANAAFLWFLVKLTGMMDPNNVRFLIEGGVWGWIVVSLVLGIANWLIREILK